MREDSIEERAQAIAKYIIDSKDTVRGAAKKFGISKSTVSKGLNHATEVSEEMRRKILEAAVELGYVNKRLQKKEKKIHLF